MRPIRPLIALSDRLEDEIGNIKASSAAPNPDWYPFRILANVPRLDVLLLKAGLTLPDPRAGLPVLDIGAADGHMSFFFERLGHQVHTVDHAPTNYNYMYGIRQLAGSLGSKISIHDIDFDARPFPPADQYAFTCLLGILYHLKNPFCVLENLARRSPYLFMSTRLLSTLVTDLFPLPAAWIAGAQELNFDHTNYWLFTRRSLRRLLARAGWEVLSEVNERTRFAPFAISPDSRDERIYVLARSAFLEHFQALQVLDGWHALEDGYLRWTTGHFRALLQSPGRPSKLHFEFFAHPLLLEQGPVELGITIDGQALPPHTIAEPGIHSLSIDCSPAPSKLCAAEFTLSRAMREPGGERELGLRVAVYGCETSGKPQPPPLRIV
jgi:SAM-dependent methyltransferase